MLTPLPALFGILLIVSVILTMLRNNNRRIDNHEIVRKYNEQRIYDLSKEVAGLKDMVNNMKHKIHLYEQKDETQQAEQTGKDEQ